MRARFLAAVALALGGSATGATPASSAPPSPVLRADVGGIITLGTAEYVEKAIAAARERRCAALLLVIDTPGGALDATRRIVRALLNAPVPIITYVAPPGARAGSAGMFIALAGHVAAMAPGTSIGAAHPVTGTGEDVAGSELARKVENDTASFARAIATDRGRNAAWAEEAVRRSVSITADEARAKDVIDLVADSPEALLTAADGRTIRLPGGPAPIATRAAEVVVFPMSVRQRVLTLLGNPSLAYLLLVFGLMGLFVELTHPGLIAPGVVGALALVFAAIGLDLLPVNLVALFLILAAVGFFVAELYITSHGLLGAAGLVCLVVGSALLVDTSSPEIFADVPLRVSWGAIAPLSLAIAAGLGALVWEIGRSQRRRSPTGREGLVGELARALTSIDATGGRVSAHGELWQARAAIPIAPEATVRIVRVEGLTLVVEPITQPRSAPPPA